MPPGGESPVSPKGRHVAQIEKNGQWHTLPNALVPGGDANPKRQKPSDRTTRIIQKDGGQQSIPKKTRYKAQIDSGHDGNQSWHDLPDSLVPGGGPGNQYLKPSRQHARTTRIVEASGSDSEPQGAGRVKLNEDKNKGDEKLKPRLKLVIPTTQGEAPVKVRAKSNLNAKL